VAPGKTAPVKLRWVRMGNTFRPAGLEFGGEWSPEGVDGRLTGS